MSARSSSAARLPVSDVSTGVGLAGLAGLFAWIAFARSWPEIAALLGLSGQSLRLGGPYSAVICLAAVALPMIVWSVFVDKVHRRPSTGIDWDRPRPISAIVDVSKVKLLGLWATWAIIAGLYMLARWYWDGQYLFAMEVLKAAIIPVIVLSLPYVLWLDRVMIEPRDASWHFGAMLLGREAWDAEQVKKHWRAWIIKGFFTAFMISILPGGFAYIVDLNFAELANNPVALALFLIQVCYVVDVQIGTVGYLVTMRPLDAHIRSGNPFLGGWVAALICYPPLVWGIMLPDGIIGYEVNTPGWNYWLENFNGLLWAWGAWLVFLTAIYAWATVAFGLRFSNLTYRGVLTHGPYRFTRHPAYLAKNLFWWSSVMPFFVTSGSTTDVIRNTVFLGVVSAIYYWRARTEEAHLLGEDQKYAEYWNWMERHGTLTRPLSALRRALRPRVPQAQPAE